MSRAVPLVLLLGLFACRTLVQPQSGEPEPRPYEVVVLDPFRDAVGGAFVAVTDGAYVGFSGDLRVFGSTDEAGRLSLDLPYPGPFDFEVSPPQGLGYPDFAVSGVVLGPAPVEIAYNGPEQAGTLTLPPQWADYRGSSSLEFSTRRGRWIRNLSASLASSGRFHAWLEEDTYSVNATIRFVGNDVLSLSLAESLRVTTETDTIRIAVPIVDYTLAVTLGGEPAPLGRIKVVHSSLEPEAAGFRIAEYSSVLDLEPELARVGFPSWGLFIVDPEGGLPIFGRRWIREVVAGGRIDLELGPHRLQVRLVDGDGGGVFDDSLRFNDGTGSVTTNLYLDTGLDGIATAYVHPGLYTIWLDRATDRLLGAVEVVDSDVFVEYTLPD